MSETQIQPIDQEQVVRDAIQLRENEILAYQININNYENILASPFEPTGDEDMDAEMLAYRDQISQLLKSEKREQAKSKLILAALRKQLDGLKGEGGAPAD